MPFKGGTQLWPTVCANLWQRLADEGTIIVPGLLQGDAAQAVLLHVRILAGRPVAEPLFLEINCTGGDSTCLRIADIIEAYGGDTAAHVVGVAYSAGLILAIACKRRTAVPNAVFLFHGSPLKDGAADDAQDAAMFGRRTGRPAEFWAEKAENGKEWQVGAEEALELGVIHEITKGGTDG